MLKNWTKELEESIRHICDPNTVKAGDNGQTMNTGLGGVAGWYGTATTSSSLGISSADKSKLSVKFLKRQLTLEELSEIIKLANQGNKEAAELLMHQQSYLSMNHEGFASNYNKLFNEGVSSVSSISGTLDTFGNLSKKLGQFLGAVAKSHDTGLIRAGTTPGVYGNHLSQTGKILRNVGKIANNPLIAPAAFALGVINGVVNEDRTWGNSIAYNGVGTALSGLVAAGAGAIAVGASAPALVVAGVVVGVGYGVTLLYDLAYKKNFLGFGDSIDSLGDVIDGLGNHKDGESIPPLIREPFIKLPPNF